MNVRLDDRIMKFLGELKSPGGLPAGVRALVPWSDPQVLALCTAFYRKYYNDRNERVLVLGINPGRFGGGVTGIPFTDPIRLEQDCGIPNSLDKRAELSSDFVYRMIDAWGGPECFYAKFFISSVSPVGYTANGTNLNYYDRPDLTRLVSRHVPGWLEKQFSFGLKRHICICLGEGKNLQFVQNLNATHGYFREVIGLPHPRFIMQYKRKQLNDYIRQYTEVLSKAAEV